jgi:hypothetical protein
LFRNLRGWNIPALNQHIWFMVLYHFPWSQLMVSSFGLKRTLYFAKDQQNFLMKGFLVSITKKKIIK